MRSPISTMNHSATVLIVDDVLDNLAILHDALNESGFTVLVANSGYKALQIAKEMQPSIILLDAIMPEMDGFQVCVKLKESMDTSHIPVVFMTGLTEVEHVAAAFQAGGADYVTKPIRPKEVLARISSHLQTAKMMGQARNVLDAFGQAAMAITPSNGQLVWQTPLARKLMQNYFGLEASMSSIATPPAILKWIEQISTLKGGEQSMPALTLIQDSKKLKLSVANLSDEQWLIVLQEESDAAQIEALMTIFKLTKRESEVLYWTIKGKTNRDVGDILGSSPRTVNKHLEHVFSKLGVETRTAAASLVTSRIRLAI
ncbi:MAG TPA: DNA-binding response regulator [Methylophilaceae bacterium]|nr:DNA-binding response regulator [Methylophilaceae bacterium]HAJ70678.1 DNA-binding response regulator [Methylophilaceae bacterium]